MLQKSVAMVQIKFAWLPQAEKLIPKTVCLIQRIFHFQGFHKNLEKYQGLNLIF